MKVFMYGGYELEKALPNTSEDYFNRSEVIYEVNGEVRTLSVLYLRYFEERMEDLTLFKNGIVCICNGKEVLFKEVFALICLLKNPLLMTQRRLYLADMEEIRSYATHVNIEELVIILQQVQPINT